MGKTRAKAVAAICAAAALTAGCGAGGGAAHPAPAKPTAKAPARPAPASAPATPADVSGLPDGYDPARDAHADVRAALARAAHTHREVLLDFGANWCPDCVALDTMFRTGTVAPLLNRDYVVVAVDVGEFNHNLDLAVRYVNLQTSGIPALVVLKPDGTKRTATDDGSFSHARTMNPGQVKAFLTRWAPGSGG